MLNQAHQGQGFEARGLNQAEVDMTSHKTAAPGNPVSDEIRPYKGEVPEEAHEDLKQRLVMTRWPERETVPDWSQGVPLDRRQALVSYWAEDYDWRAAEARLNGFPQFRTQIDGLGIH